MSLSILHDPMRTHLTSFSHLRPGGWYEQVEYSVHWRADDGSIPKDHAFERWSDLFVEAGEKIGRTFRILDLQTDFIKEAGFTNVNERKFKMPVGPWSSDPKLKDVGRYHLLECYQGIEGWSMALLTRLYGVSTLMVFSPRCIMG
jgi:hypothetical protein